MSKSVFDESVVPSGVMSVDTRCSQVELGSLLELRCRLCA